MTITDLLIGRERIEVFIDNKINTFLNALHAAGGYAPTVSDTGFGGGRDSIERVEFDGQGGIRLCCQNWFRGEPRGFTVEYPAALVDSCDANALNAFVAAQKQAKADRISSDAAKEAERVRVEDLRALGDLRRKYPEAEAQK